MQLEQPSAIYNGKPNLDNGYLRISNELLEAIVLFDFTSRQLKVLLSLIRVTYGFNKKQDSISGWQLSKMTNISQQNISKTLKELVAMNVILKHEEGRFGHGVFINEISLNKYYLTWKTINKTTINEMNRQQNNHQQVVTSTINEMIIQPSTKQCTHKDISKDNTKDICVECLIYLNEKTKRSYKPVKANLDFIKARLTEGFTKQDVFHVIDVKVSQWINDSDMNKYLRPATLFNASKFAQYAAEKVKQKRNELVL